MQLLDYRTGGVTNLVAITERYPEVPESWLRKHGIACLRWRDIHRALRPEGRSVDAFVCRAFRDYLEESDMAYKPITVADLTKLGKTFRTIGRKRGWNVNNLAFRTADDVLGLLDEVRRGLADSLPATAARPITATGPGYFFYHGDDDPAFAEHQLTFSLYRRDRSKGGGRDRALLVMFAFPEPASGEASLNVFGFNHVERAVLGRIYSRSLGKLVDHDGHIDVRNVLAFAQSVSRKIGVPVKWALKE